MYVVVYKNEVISGPSEWHKGIFDIRLEEVGITTYTPRSVPALPYVINEDAKILECELTVPTVRPRVEYLEGPFITDVTGDKAIGHYNLKEQPLDSIKYNLKQEVAAERYKKEIAGTTITINGQDLFVDTNRGTRDIFVQKYLLMNDNDTVAWKFPSGFVTLSKVDLGQIVQAGAQHVQDAFVWEATKGAEIDACTTIDQLNDFVIIEPPVNVDNQRV